MAARRCCGKRSRVTNGVKQDAFGEEAFGLTDALRRLSATLREILTNNGITSLWELQS